MPVFLVSSDRKPLKYSMVFRITVLNPSRFHIILPVIRSRPTRVAILRYYKPQSGYAATRPLSKSERSWYAFLFLALGITTTFHQVTMFK
ncbi:hypothetical protein TNCV_3284771 [Trichonephila clavipes]|nr:hypothetical protein TNCV_3284771 [Trichonephila clavipes]